MDELECLTRKGCEVQVGAEEMLSRTQMVLVLNRESSWCRKVAERE